MSRHSIEQASESDGNTAVVIAQNLATIEIQQHKLWYLGSWLSICALIDVLLPAATAGISPPNHLARPCSDISWRALILGKIPLCCSGRAAGCQGVAITNLFASTEWAPLSLLACAIISTHLVAVQPPLSTVVADPMHKLVALKCCFVRKYAIYGIALIVPLKQQQMLRLLECWLLGVRLVKSAATWAPCIILNPGLYHSLPFVSAVWTSPVSPGVTASKCLLRCLDILVKIPISCYCGCFGGKGVVQAQLPALTIWTLCPSCPVGHLC